MKLETGLKQEETDFSIAAKYRIRLFFVIIAFIAIFTFFSYLRYADFYTSNWDFGIFQQMFWSTSHGKLLYESGDYIGYGVNSFLEIHSGYIAFFFSFLYSFYPTPITIFIIQTTAVSLMIIPLYKIALYYGASQSTAFIFSIPVLLNFAIISAMFYDFHLESIIPLEFLSLFYFAIRKKYLWLSLVFILGCMTLEVFPFLSAGLGLYLLFQYFSVRNRTGKTHVSQITFPILLILVSGVSYVVIRIVQYNILPPILGNTVSMAVPGNSLSGNLFSLFYVTSTPVSVLASLVYWVLLLASLAFIPLTRPMSLILAIPWIAASVFLHPFFSYQFGNQYAFIAISPLLVGYAQVVGVFNDQRGINSNRKMRTINGYFIPLALISPIPGISYLLIGFNYVTIAAPVLILVSICIGTIAFLYYRKNTLEHYITSIKKLKISKRLTNGKSPFLILVILLLVFNISFGPLNIVNFNVNPNPGYQFEYKISPAGPHVVSMVKTVPYNSTFVISDNLFPYAANRLNSYAFLWYPQTGSVYSQYFPFNSSHLPDFVMVSSVQSLDLPHFMQNELHNTTNYGIVALLQGNGTVGNVYLYELGFKGTTVYTYY